MSQQKPSIQDFATGIAEVVKLTLTQPEPQAPQTMLPADPRLVVAMNEIARLTADRDQWKAAHDHQYAVAGTLLREAEHAAADRDRALALLEQAWWMGRLSAIAQGLEPPNATGPRLRARCKQDIDALLSEEQP